jgi:predicted PurR-regulated permease PerM
MARSPSRPPRIELTVSWATLLKLVVFAALVFAGIKLLPLFGLLFLALLISMTLAPLVGWLTRRGVPKWAGVALCAVLVFGSVALFLFVVTPVATAQVSELIKRLPTFKTHILQQLPAKGPMHDLAEGLLKAPAFADPAPLLGRFVEWGAVALQSVVELFVILIVAIYLVADGRRVYEWIVAFLPERQRQRVEGAAPEIFTVVFSYMGGQLITSLLCAIFIWAVLTFFQVPNALLLAILGGIFDILPIIGFFLALVPALAMALTVSSFTAGCVAALYTGYHLLESYFIVPRVYGNRLRLSTLTVLVSCLAAGMLGGVVGVIAVLPIIACFPIVERTWLRPLLGAETVAKHDEIEEKEHPTT